jgi:hypothetical protein
MIDVFFIEFFIMRMYNQKLEEYYKVTKAVASAWRLKKFPDRRYDEFTWREGTSDILELFNKIYPKK